MESNESGSDLKQIPTDRQNVSNIFLLHTFLYNNYYNII